MCERAREWASLGLDGELSELERALLSAHTKRCYACAQYVAEVGVITTVIRETPLQRLSYPVELPIRRRLGWSSRVLQAGAATAAVVAATAGLALQFGPAPASHGLLIQRLPESAIESGPNLQLSDSDALIRAPKLAAIKGRLGIGVQRGLRIPT